ncbi:MAG: Ig-like domain-containing protein, partial [Maribacter dokdonensis]|uniref:Ig-like domain-containing protein n=1 Tax=Maribacter dokdonensis TaxID=320912 RepID=UPI003298875E
MKTYQFFILIFIFNISAVSAQNGLNVIGASVSITDGASIRVDQGDFYIADEGSISNASEISVDGNWLNNNTVNQVFTTDSEGVVTLTKTTDITTIGGSNTTLFYNLILEVDQATLEVNTIVGGSISGTNLGILDLKDVSLDLNSNTLQITNSLIGALITNEGYIISEDVLNQSKVLWQTSATGGAYTIPFGTAAGEHIPLTVERATGNLGEITVSTFPTGLDMTPYPTQPENVTSIVDTNDQSLSGNSVNRFWQLDKTGTGVANLTFTYADAEVPSSGENNLSSYRYDTTVNKWEPKGASSSDFANNKVSVSGVAEFSPWTIAGGTPEDLDGDGIANADDLDNDNDGILDTDEGVCTPNQSGSWGGFTNNISYDYGDGVVVRITNAAGHLGTGNFNAGGAGFWSEDLPGDAAAGGNFDFGESITITFEDGAGNPVNVTNPSIHFDLLGESDGITQNSAEVTLQDGLTWRKLGGTDDFFATSTTVRDAGAGTTSASGSYTGQSTQNDLDGTAAGSLQIQGTLSTFTLTFPKAEPTTGTTDTILMIIFACQQIDFDNDGIPNFLDVDSDNDGCPDAIEGNGSYNYNDIDENYTLTAAVDGTGVPGGSPQAVGTTQNSSQQAAECSECHPTNPSYVDSDNDTIGDFCDVDDDNDGILDTDEMQVQACGAYPALSFSSPVLVSGTALNSGAVYRFSNVTTGVDALVTILASTPDPGIVSIDDDGSNIANFQPILETGSSQVEFDFNFVDSGTSNLVVIPQFYITAVDVDGDNIEGREIVELDITGGSAHTVETPSDLTVYNTAYGKMFHGPITVAPGIDVNATNVMFTARYALRDQFKMRIGANPTSGVNRLFSMNFDPCVYNIYSNPSNSDLLLQVLDTDADGIPNHLGTDSDNDTCTDATEAGHTDDDNDGEVDGTGYDANGQVTGASTAYTGTTNGVTTASETTVDTAPTDQEERVGDDATFTVAASVLDASAYTSGTPTYDVNASPTYQWQVSTNSGSTFSDISGATGSNLTISDVTLIMDGNIYKVLVSSANNSCPEEAQATLTVINNVDAIDDSAGITAVEGFTGIDDVINVFDNDEFNGAILNPSSVTITPTSNGPLTVNGDGSVDVASNTGSGSYTVNYQICDATNPTNCDIATVTVNVGVNSLPTAQDDDISIAQDSSNNAIDVLANNGNGPDDFGGDGPNAGAITLPSTSTTNGGTVSVDDNSTPLDPTDDTVLYTPAAGYSGSDSFTYTITDANNDSDTVTVNVTVVPTPTIAINVVAGDDIINATEDDSPVTISGTTTNVENGQTATVTLNGQIYTTIVSANTWTLDISATDAQALDANETITADVDDVAGNSATQTTRDIQHITTLPVPVLNIDDITADNILNATEAAADVTVTGTVSGDFNTGDTVTLTVDGTDYTGTVDAVG